MGDHAECLGNSWSESEAALPFQSLEPGKDTSYGRSKELQRSAAYLILKFILKQLH